MTLKDLEEIYKNEKEKYAKILTGKKDADIFESDSELTSLPQENYCQGRYDGIQWALMQLEAFEGRAFEEFFGMFKEKKE